MKLIMNILLFALTLAFTLNQIAKEELLPELFKPLPNITIPEETFDYHAKVMEQATLTGITAGGIAAQAANIASVCINDDKSLEFVPHIRTVLIAGLIAGIATGAFQYRRLSCAAEEEKSFWKALEEQSNELIKNINNCSPREHEMITKYSKKNTVEPNDAFWLRLCNIRFIGSKVVQHPDRATITDTWESFLRTGKIDPLPKESVFDQQELTSFFQGHALHAYHQKIQRALNSLNKPSRNKKRRRKIDSPVRKKPEKSAKAKGKEKE